MCIDIEASADLSMNPGIEKFRKADSYQAFIYYRLGSSGLSHSNSGDDRRTICGAACEKEKNNSCCTLITYGR